MSGRHVLALLFIVLLACMILESLQYAVADKAVKSGNNIKNAKIPNSSNGVKGDMLPKYLHSSGLNFTGASGSPKGSVNGNEKHMPQSKQLQPQIKPVLPSVTKPTPAPKPAETTKPTGPPKPPPSSNQPQCKDGYYYEPKLQQCVAK